MNTHIEMNDFEIVVPKDVGTLQSLEAAGSTVLARNLMIRQSDGTFEMAQERLVRLDLRFLKTGRSNDGNGSSRQPRFVVEADGLLGNGVSRFSLIWQWVLMCLSIFLAGSLIAYAGYEFAYATSKDAWDLIFFSGVTGVMLLISSLYAVIASDGLQHLANAPPELQIAALVNISVGLLVGMGIVAALMITASVIIAVIVVIGLPMILLLRSGD